MSKETEQIAVASQKAQVDVGEKAPIHAVVKDGLLSVAIGIQTLAFAFENSPTNMCFNMQLDRFERICRVVDPFQFAEDVRKEIVNEADYDDRTLGQFLDAMMERAVENGSHGVEEICEE